MNQNNIFKKRLIIVDVSNFIFRAFFAVRPLHTPEGVPVNAVYGIFTMLLKLLADHKPTHLFLARDTKGGTFRNRIYEEYKAHRSEPPEDLIPQFALIDKLIERMNFPTFSHDNFEADDIIGSACVQWRDQFDEIFIASGDKDLMQFVGGNIKLLDTMKDKLYTPQDVEEKMGVRPDQIVDFLSMVGDSSDNIPGMKGIGSVGAANLLKEYGTFENILANKDHLKGKKIIEAFSNHLNDGLLSKKLVQIVTDVELGHTPDETAVHFYPTNELSEYLKELGFKNALTKLQEIRFQYHMGKENDRRLEPEAPVDLSSPLFQVPVASTVNIIKCEQVPQELHDAKLVAIHFIYNGEDIFARTVSQVFCSIGGDDVFQLNSIPESLFQNPNLEIIGENIKRDIVHCMTHKIETKAQFFDIGLAHYNINTNTRHDVDTLMKEYLHQELSSDEQTANAERALALFSLAEKLKQRLAELDLLKVYSDIDLKVTPVLAEMEVAGILLNPNYLVELEHELQKEIHHIEKKIYEVADGEINLNSPKQVGTLLFEKLQLPVIKKTKTGYSTDAEVLEELDGMNLSEVPGLMLTHREYGKILSTYVKALPLMVNPQTKRIHTNFNLTVAQTGRLSSTNPNLQNIPIRSEMGQKVRRAFIAKPGMILLSADYSQVELRLLAHFSEDPTMLKSFKDNIDIHIQTASEILGISPSKVTSRERSMAKTVNFGLMYGQSSFGLASTLKISRTEAKNYIDKYFSHFNSVKKFLDSLKDKAEQTGFAETYHGRKRFLPDIHSQNRTIKAQAERMAINSPIQGTAADILKLAMIHIDHELKEKKLRSKMLLQVHDELIFEVVEEEIDTMKELVRRHMENVVDLKVPLKVEMGIGVNWYDLK